MNFKKQNSRPSASVIRVESETGSIVLTNLLQDEGVEMWDDTLYLEIRNNFPDEDLSEKPEPAYWDVRAWIDKLYKHLKKNKKSKIVKTFKEDCENLGLNYKNEAKSYVSCYRRMADIEKELAKLNGETR